MRRIATAVWKGGTRAGEGAVSTASGVFDKVVYTFGISTTDVPCTNPCELLAAAQAACMSMMVAKELAKSRIEADYIETKADLELADDGHSKGWHIPRIHLTVKASVREVDDKKFRQAVQRAKHNCPITKSLKSEITMETIVEPVMASMAE